LPIVVTPSGIVTELRAVQPVKAPLPIVVTLSGIVTEMRAVQAVKAISP
jgi:hypothetical protein